jgi:hypothetical protein
VLDHLPIIHRDASSLLTSADMTTMAILILKPGASRRGRESAGAVRFQ